jgi:hypothetical protein
MVRFSEECLYASQQDIKSRVHSVLHIQIFIKFCAPVLEIVVQDKALLDPVWRGIGFWAIYFEALLNERYHV